MLTAAPSPLPSADREAQALACLEAAARHREPLLALAVQLTGSEEEGMNLYQQTLLACHDAIQRNGFAGERYEFYLYTSLRNGFRKAQRPRREVAHDFQQAEARPGSRDDEGAAPWAAQVQRQGRGSTTQTGSLAPATDAHADLAEQVMAEARERFGFADRIALRLHVEGFSYRDIGLLLGRCEGTYIWRRVERMKVALRETFAQAWQALHESD